MGASGPSSRGGDRGLFFRSPGKILLTGEYFILDGARSIALPTSLGQSLRVRHAPSFHPRLRWRSLDERGDPWLEAEFEFWHFGVLGGGGPPDERVRHLQAVLRAARGLNIHFLRDGTDVFAETRLEFPLDWGLGSSSTLVFNVARWARVPPLELFSRVHEGSGYDVACAEAGSPILYRRSGRRPSWEPLPFRPSFGGGLHFVHLGTKKRTTESIGHYRSAGPFPPSTTARVSAITERVAGSRSLDEFRRLMEEHEDVVSGSLGLPKAKDLHFRDFPGSVKSLGAWGGDFVLAASRLGRAETARYFGERGFPVCVPYAEFVATARPAPPAPAAAGGAGALQGGRPGVGRKPCPPVPATASPGSPRPT